MAEDSIRRWREFAIRNYDHVRDLSAVKRIWRECGWTHQDNEVFVDDFYSVGNSTVACLDEVPECAVHVSPGAMRYQDEDLILAAVTAVVTSHIARKRGLAQVATAEALAAAAERGADVAGLGMFEQGFYDQLGFGSSSYEHIIAFDPNDLKTNVDFRIPVRLANADWRRMHQSLMTRWIGHGGCVLYPPELVKAEAGWKKDGFGLGYEDDQGELSHFFFGTLEGEYGPLNIAAMAYRDGAQLMELFALLRSLGDQVASVSMIEPPHVQLQDLLKQPFRFRRISQGSSFENRQKSSSFCQLRILNLEQCLAKTHLHRSSCDFNLVLRDPVTAHLNEGRSWSGVGGEYTIQLGEDCVAEPGLSKDLPTLQASVGAFSRMWFGMRPASQLAITDELQAPTDLLGELDDIFCLPAAAWGWYF